MERSCGDGSLFLMILPYFSQNFFFVFYHRIRSLMMNQPGLVVCSGLGIPGFYPVNWLNRYTSLQLP